MFGNKIKKLQEENMKLRESLARAQRLLAHAENDLNKQQTFTVYYTITDSDTIKFGKNIIGMQKEAQRRMAGFLGRAIVRQFGANEITEGGRLVGYSIEVKATRNPAPALKPGTWCDPKDL